LTVDGDDGRPAEEVLRFARERNVGGRDGRLVVAEK